MLRFATLVLSVLLLAACSGTPTVAPTSALQRFKEASGGDAWRGVKALRLQGRLHAAGMAGDFSQTEELARGRSRTDFTLGPIQGAQGYDGTAGWRRDPGGEIATIDGETALLGLRTVAWLARRGYWFDHAAEYHEQSREVDGHRYTVVAIRAEGIQPVELWLDEDSGLAERIVTGSGEAAVVTRLSDYRDVEGLRLPFRIQVDRGEDVTTRVVSEIAQVAIVPAPGDAFFAAPAGRDAADIGGGATTHSELPIELVGSHVYLEARIDGQPVKLVLDTGAVNVLTPAAAERLGLKIGGRITAVGAGEQSARAGMTRVGRVEIGDMHMDNQLFYVIDMGDITAVENLEFDGLVGYELLQRFVAEVDYAGRRLTLIEPDAFVPPVDGRRVPLEFDDRTPIAPGMIDGLPARFALDTGSRGTLTVHAPYVREHKLIERYGANIETVTGWGVGGPVMGRPVRFGTLHLGDFPMQDVLGNLSTVRSGALANANVAGNLGSALLRRFVVTFDYRNRAMYLAPNGEPVKRANYDRLGGFLMRGDADSLRLGTITPGGAAERAGLRVDDHLLAVEGEPVAARSLSDWRELFRDTAPGTPLLLSVRRGGESLQIRVVLSELIP